MRLVEIQEMLCTDSSRGEQQCQNLAEEHESEIEQWWKLQDEYPGKSRVSLSYNIHYNLLTFQISLAGFASIL